MKKLILFIGLLLFAFLNVCAQKEYQIEQVSAINMGDGRILFRDLKTDKPLDGEHPISWLTLKKAFTMVSMKSMNTTN